MLMLVQGTAQAPNTPVISGISAAISFLAQELQQHLFAPALNEIPLLFPMLLNLLSANAPRAWV